MLNIATKWGGIIFLKHVTSLENDLPLTAFNPLTSHITVDSNKQNHI
jgi:hypothetical protein